jgi:hypothetical protein
MKRSLSHIIVLSLLLWPAGSTLAQVKATVDKQHILIGEPIQLMLEATVKGTVPLVWPALDSLPHFDFVEKGVADSTVSPDQRYYRQHLTVTSFDSGTWSIPRLPFKVGNKIFFTDSIPIQIGYTPIDASKDYHDIKDIVEVPNPFARWFGWIIAGIALLSVGLVAWMVRRKKLLKVLAPWKQAPQLSPFEEAIRQLDDLAKQRLIEDGAFKTFYSRLGDILRLYLFRRMGIASLSETSEELIVQIRQLSLPQKQFLDVAEALRMGDFVKFAKYQPGLADSESHYVTIREAIEELDRRKEADERIQAAIAGQSNRDQPATAAPTK